MEAGTVLGTNMWLERGWGITTKIPCFKVSPSPENPSCQPRPAQPTVLKATETTSVQQVNYMEPKGYTSWPSGGRGVHLGERTTGQSP